MTCHLGSKENENTSPPNLPNTAKIALRRKTIVLNVLNIEEKIENKGAKNSSL